MISANSIDEFRQQQLNQTDLFRWMQGCTEYQRAFTRYCSGLADAAELVYNAAEHLYGKKLNVKFLSTDTNCITSVEGAIITCDRKGNLEIRINKEYFKSDLWKEYVDHPDQLIWNNHYIQKRRDVTYLVQATAIANYSASALDVDQPAFCRTIQHKILSKKTLAYKAGNLILHTRVDNENNALWTKYFEPLERKEMADYAMDIIWGIGFAAHRLGNDKITKGFYLTEPRPKAQDNILEPFEVTKIGDDLVVCLWSPLPDDMDSERLGYNSPEVRSWEISGFDGKPVEKTLTMRDYVRASAAYTAGKAIIAHEGLEPEEFKKISMSLDVSLATAGNNIRRAEIAAAEQRIGKQ